MRPIMCSVHKPSCVPCTQCIKAPCTKRSHAKYAWNTGRLCTYILKLIPLYAPIDYTIMTNTIMKYTLKLTCKLQAL